MKFEPTPLKDVYVLEPRVFGDERGFFTESLSYSCEWFLCLAPTGVGETEYYSKWIYDCYIVSIHIALVL